MTPAPLLAGDSAADGGDAMHPGHGFLPTSDPLRRLPQAFEPWKKVAAALPDLLSIDSARREIEALPLLGTEGLHDEPALSRAMLILSFLGAAAVWERHAQGGVPRVPRAIAVPWMAVAARLGRPPCLAYASHALANWRRIDPEGPIDLGNLALLQNFYGDKDEDWFILVHVAIEAHAARAADAIDAAQQAVRSGDDHALLDSLHMLAAAQAGMLRTLARMPEGCSPEVFYRRVRPFLQGFRDVAYDTEDGVKIFDFPGASAAQSAALPLLDAALGLAHADDPLSVHSASLRRFMPAAHLRRIERTASGPSIRAAVLRTRRAPLIEAYNDCLQSLCGFREAHVRLVADYILQWTDDGLGTGGTPLVHHLGRRP